MTVRELLLDLIEANAQMRQRLQEALARLDDAPANYVCRLCQTASVPAPDAICARCEVTPPAETDRQLDAFYL